MGKNLVLIGCGGALYVLVELCYRGRSHGSMFLLGGVQMALGAWGITCAEFLTGLVVNRALGLGVWDYSKQPHNLMGQICLPFAACWVGLAGAAVILDDILRLALFGEAFLLPPVF